MFRKLAETLRISVFFLVAFSIWATWSIAPFFQNRPADFQAAGSIVVAWAIFFYGKDRLFRENAIHSSNKALFTAAHNSLNARLEFHRSLAENTQNMNSLAYARLLRVLGLRDEELGDNDKAIQNLEATSEETEAHYKLGEDARRADMELEKQIGRSNEMEEVQGKWTKIVYIAELGLVIFGTIQWGYGDRWVEAVHATYPELNLWWSNQFL